MKLSTKKSIKKLFAIFVLEFVPVVIACLLVPYVLTATSLPENYNLYRIFLAIGVVLGWIKIRDAILDFVAEVFFTED